MKKVLLLLLVTIFVTSCSWWDINTEKEKQDFILDTMLFSEFSQEAILQKSWKIWSSQDINLTSQANGRVKNIFVRDGDSVLEGQIIAILDDSVSNYWLSLERAKNGVNRSKISYDSNKISLDKTVFDAEQSEKIINNNLKALINDSAENIKKAQTDLDNTNINLDNSKGALEIKKIENSIIKSELDYDNQIISDSETLESFYSNIKKEYNSMIIFLDDIIEFSDTLYGITDWNEDINDKFDSFLWAQDISQKKEAKVLIREIISFNQGEFSSINIDNIKTKQELETVLLLINTWFNKSKILLNEVELTLNNSIDSSTSFSISQIDAYKSNVNTYQASLQWNYSWFLAFDNSISSFLRTYKNSQLSIQKSIDLMKKDLEIIKKWFNISSTLAEVSFNKTIINSDDAISSMEIQLASADNTLLNAKKIREVNLRSMQNAINEANITYKTAIKEYEKLTISSPISGTISDINIDLWQEINIWTHVFSIVNNTENEVDISFNKDELSLVSEWSIVYIKYDNNTYTGSIYSLSQTADDNLKYRSVVVINDDINLIGNIVMVDVPVMVNHTLVPLNIIKIKDSGLWTMNIVKQMTQSGATILQIEQLEVKIWEIYSDKVEIVNEVDAQERIILNYVDNFDKDKFKLKLNTK